MGMCKIVDAKNGAYALRESDPLMEAIRLRAGGGGMPIDNHQIDSLLELVLKKTGTDLSGYRKPTLSRRISERLFRLGMDADQYLRACRDDPEECGELVNAVTINVSSFFRNPVAFEIIAQSVLPRLIDLSRPELRVWSAGCAAGEEAYSLAMLILRALKSDRNNNTKPRIFATDIDRNVLQKARKAFYCRESLIDTKLGIIDDFFSSVKDGFQLCSEVKEMVNFSFYDLLSDQTVVPAKSIYGSFDIVLCRNVLIYFSAEQQIQVFQKLYKALAKGGYLVLGDSEMLCRDIRSRFRTVDKKNRIYQKLTSYPHSG
jgi:chemotaxis protein methyltransferase CheR